MSTLIILTTFTSSLLIHFRTTPKAPSPMVSCSLRWPEHIGQLQSLFLRFLRFFLRENLCQKADCSWWIGQSNLKIVFRHSQIAVMATAVTVIATGTVGHVVPQCARFPCSSKLWREVLLRRHKVSNAAITLCDRSSRSPWVSIEHLLTALQNTRWIGRYYRGRDTLFADAISWHTTSEVVWFFI